MDKIPEPDAGGTVTPATFEDKCRVMDEFFHDQGLSKLEFEIKDTGLYSSPTMPFLQVKKWTSPGDMKVHSMRLCWSYCPDPYSNGKYKFIRELKQELTKPLNIHLSMTRTPGFDYRLKNKENVVISRLLVEPRNIEESISLLMNEANRFYILYCMAS